MSKQIDSTLEESFEYDGLWWLPSDPENEVSGRLSYAPNEGITLKLIGAFADILGLSDFHVDILHGMTTEGHICTLYGASSSNFVANTPGIISQTLTFRNLIVGYHYPSVEQIKFSWKSTKIKRAFICLVLKNKIWKFLTIQKDNKKNLNKTISSK